jgi:hypothetical protein
LPQHPDEVPASVIADTMNASSATVRAAAVQSSLQPSQGITFATGKALMRRWLDPIKAALKRV